ncbi:MULTISPECIES: hypothetical protein [unclassified Gordonia (in: high G+C Gram-positive bacteria)]|uniref:hypothetical protein n=1 Tax=unclassified Gordonia (in: high G+C Gram-positive bacteria) TaxID=2657482 RepID=UPI000AD099DF|nr:MULTISPECIES: hypothetical protein [unclassified Gordonia (in: high G+C Gram-positive bacteria)]
MTATRALTATSLLQRMGTNKAVSQVMRRSVPLDRSIADSPADGSISYPAHFCPS